MTQPGRDEPAHVDPFGGRKIRCEAEGPGAVDHAGGPYPDREGFAHRRHPPSQLGDQLGDGVGDLGTRFARSAVVDLGRREPSLRHNPAVASERDPVELGPADVDAEGDPGVDRRTRAHAEDSTRALSSRSAVSMIRLWARILMNPGIGTRSSTSR